MGAPPSPLHGAGGWMPPQGPQGSIFWRDPASQDIFPPIAIRKREWRWSKYGQKFLLLTHHATREEGRSLTHLWSVLQTTRKTIHFSWTRLGHQKPPCLQPQQSRTAPSGEESLGCLQGSHFGRDWGTDPVTFPQ